MKKSEYIEKVIEQVRCKSVHEPLKMELEAHIDDQAEAFINVGLSEAEAEEEAVKTMGDAAEIGVGLDAVHRPKFPMSAALVAMLLMTVGLAARIFVCRDFTFYRENSLFTATSIPLAITVMAVCYFMDYTVFTKFPKSAYSVFLFVLSALCLMRRKGLLLDSDRSEAGRMFFFGIMLLTPLVCGFVWSMRGKGFGGFFISCLVLVIPAAFVALCIPCLSALILIGISALAIMTYAVKNNFFRVRKILAYLFMYIPAVTAVWLFWALKFKNPMWFVDGSKNINIQYGFVSYNGYWDFPAALSEARWFGSCIDYGTNSMIPEVKDQFMLAAVVIRLGWTAGIAVALLLLALPIILLVKSAKIKNVFGRMTAFSIGIVFLFVTVSYVLANFGITTAISSICTPPFMTASPLNAISCGALLGIFMSAYGKKDIFPERKINAFRPKIGG